MKKIYFIVLAIIIIVGIAITATVGLNVDLIYKPHEQINIYIGKETNIKEIEDISKEVFGKQRVRIVKIELFNDAFALNTEAVSDEQIENLRQKVGEKFEIEDTYSAIVKSSIPKLRLRDLAKPYVKPIIISTIIILAFMAVRFKKLGSLKVILQMCIMLILAGLLLLSIIAITRCPINQYVVPGVLTVYFATIFVSNIQNIKELEKQKLMETKNNN